MKSLKRKPKYNLNTYFYINELIENTITKEPDLAYDKNKLLDELYKDDQIKLLRKEYLLKIINDFWSYEIVDNEFDLLYFENMDKFDGTNPEIFKCENTQNNSQKNKNKKNDAKFFFLLYNIYLILSLI